MMVTDSSFLASEFGCISISSLAHESVYRVWSLVSSLGLTAHCDSDHSISGDMTMYNLNTVEFLKFSLNTLGLIHLIIAYVFRIYTHI